MTHIGVIDNFSHTPTKGTEINMPVTVLECPPVKVLSVRLFAQTDLGNSQVCKEVTTTFKDKHLARSLDLPKKAPKVPTVEELQKFAEENDVHDVRIKVATTPSLTGVGQKKPEIMEIGLSGAISDQIAFAHGNLGKEVRASDILQPGEQVDSHGITKGKGHQGAVKRFGVKLTAIKSEKKRRHAGNVGAWTPARVLPSTPLPGQHGYHERTELNKWIIKISDKPEEVNPSSGFKHYGLVKNEYILVKGSIQGPQKRPVTLVKGQRPHPRFPKVAPQIVHIGK